jgi:hypothetical protein
MRNRLASILFLISMLLSSGASFLWAERPLPVFCVVGVKNNVDQKEWKDMGVGFGVNNLVAQYVYESGTFRPLEEKEEVKAQISKVRELYWNFAKDMKDEDLRQLQGPADADFFLFGEVTGCRTSHQKSFVGLLSSYKRFVRVQFRLYMIEKKSGKIISAQGEGRSEKGANAFIFEAKAGKIDFNSTMSGIATENAVKDAVEKLIKKYNSIKGGE